MSTADLVGFSHARVIYGRVRVEGQGLLQPSGILSLDVCCLKCLSIQQIGCLGFSSVRPRSCPKCKVIVGRGCVQLRSIPITVCEGCSPQATRSGCISTGVVVFGETSHLSLDDRVIDSQA